PPPVLPPPVVPPPVSPPPAVPPPVLPPPVLPPPVLPLPTLPPLAFPVPVLLLVDVEVATVVVGVAVVVVGVAVVVAEAPPPLLAVDDEASDGFSATVTLAWVASTWSCEVALTWLARFSVAPPPWALLIAAGWNSASGVGAPCSAATSWVACAMLA